MDFRDAYFSVWRSAWDYHKEYADMTGTDEEWDRAVDEAGKVIKRYDNTAQFDFAKALILAVLDELERREKYRRGPTSSIN